MLDIKKQNNQRMNCLQEKNNKNKIQIKMKMKKKKYHHNNLIYKTKKMLWKD